MTRFAPDPSIETPATMLHMAMDAAAVHGRMPDFTPDSLLEILNLHTEQPDGYTLAERLVSHQPSNDAWRSVTYFKYAARELITAANARETNDAQEVIAQSLGGVVCRQLSRERELCPIAGAMALSVTRDDIVPAHVRTRLRGPRSFEESFEGFLGYAHGTDLPLGGERAVQRIMDELFGPDSGETINRLGDTPMGSIVIVRQGFGPPPDHLMDLIFGPSASPRDYSEFVEPAPTAPIPDQQKPAGGLRKWCPPFGRSEAPGR